MEGCNFWADLLDTYQSTSDWVKALWILMWPAFVLSVLALVLQYRLALARLRVSGEGRPANDDDDQVARFRRVLTGRM